jgi:HEAT repeat protein
MIAAAFALALAASARAEGPASTVAGVMKRADAIVAEETGKDADAVATLDKRAMALFKELAPLRWRAAAPLGDAARDLRRAPKARLLAVMYLSRLRDPAAFRPLSEALVNPDQDADVRVAAAQGLAALDVAPAAPRKAFCATLAQPDLPAPLVDEILIAVARLGCDDPAPLEKIARAGGLRPEGPALLAARRALTAMTRSPDPASASRLLALVAYFPAGGDLRRAAIGALEARKRDLVTALVPESLPVVREALRSETNDPATMLVLIRLADAFGPETDDMLLALTAHPDAEVLTVAAEALARRKDVRAVAPLEAVIAGALTDPRFAPKPGRPEPAQLLERIEAAHLDLLHARSEQR